MFLKVSVPSRSRIGAVVDGLRRPAGGHVDLNGAGCVVIVEGVDAAEAVDLVVAGAVEDELSSLLPRSRASSKLEPTTLLMLTPSVNSARSVPSAVRLGRHAPRAGRR